MPVLKSDSLSSVNCGCAMIKESVHQKRSTTYGSQFVYRESGLNSAAWREYEYPVYFCLDLPLISEQIHSNHIK
ncbi:hypothetical protein T11_1958 [Trichinella zimbabwensis]|uniref:Uncharacterized protein n=1 Tax=Trichinella zimbabwensis TaxID=268475 RepID=A0A0V1HEV6_9BILA|nr:hypothetical protein T11_1958 [Trichinella zimbabwensis]